MSSRRFENRDPVLSIRDRDPIARPSRRRTTENATGTRDARAPMLYGMSIPWPRAAARGVNSIGEVPDSTWFENRIGVRDLTAEEIARGPGDGRGPVLPIVVLGSKRAGRSLGLLVEDALGDRFILKFDRREGPEVQTANEVISGRLLWAVGYHVPENHLVVLPRADLILGDEATLALPTGEEVPMTPDDLEDFLARAAPAHDGTSLRALASKILPGVPIGGYPEVGVRRDDSNDRIPHQLRRDVRAQRIFFGWLGHTDVKEGNTLDTWIETPEGSGRGYVRHHLVDFGLSLGAKARYDLRPHDGYAHDFDMKWGLASLFTLGLYRRPWERAPIVELPGIGRYDVEHFDPARFRPTRPYVPFLYADRFDGFWASKIVIRFRPGDVEAVVAEARFADPRSTRHVVDAILGRARRTALHWFAQVNPIDGFRVERDGDRTRICAEDLLLRYALGSPPETRYRVDAFAYDEQPLGRVQTLAARQDGLVCVGAPPIPSERNGYLMVRYRTRRGTEELPPVVAHFARHPATGELRLIGVDRR